MPYKKPGAAVAVDAIWGTNGTARTGDISIDAVMPNDRITLEVEHDFDFVWGTNGVAIDIGHEMEVTGVWGTNGISIQVEHDGPGPADVTVDVFRFEDGVDVAPEDPGLV